MITNPLLEELWAIKDRLDAEAGGDIHVFCEQLRAWESSHLPKGRVPRTPGKSTPGLRARQHRKHSRCARSRLPARTKIGAAKTLMPEIQIPIQPVENPILCSPYQEPDQHWLYDTKIGIPSKTPGRPHAGLGVDPKNLLALAS